MSTAAPLQPKSSGPLSQPTEPVSCNLRSLLVPGWAGEGLPCCSFLNLLLTRGWEVMTGALFKPISSPPLQPTSVSINPSSALSGRRVRLPQATEFSETIHLGSSRSGAPSGPPPLPALALTNLRTKDTFSALQPREGTPLVPAAARLPLGLPAAH